MSTKHHERREEQREDAAMTSGVPDEGLAPEAAAAREAAQGGGQAEADKKDAELSSLRAKVAELEGRAAALTEECSSLKDQYLRKLADYENFRKRMFRERDDSLKYANAGLLGDLVPILDDFDRAVASAEHAKDYRVLHDGVLIIRRQLGQTLEGKYGLLRYECVGQAFDPNVHEAVATEPGPVAEPTVAEELLPGYRLHERIVRTAKVRVRMPAPGTAAPEVEASPAGSAEAQN